MVDRASSIFLLLAASAASSLVRATARPSCAGGPSLPDGAPAWSSLDRSRLSRSDSRLWALRSLRSLTALRWLWPSDRRSSAAGSPRRPRPLLLYGSSSSLMLSIDPILSFLWLEYSRESEVSEFAEDLVGSVCLGLYVGQWACIRSSLRPEVSEVAEVLMRSAESMRLGLRFFGASPSLLSLSTNANSKTLASAPSLPSRTEEG
mmetsp:Transcript_6664/g.13972  ORF Transcript_6664/g.13972 Transcript_6664/m.13972 type:complete len:205 (+) Transcript_6664:462-1076(+)